MPAARFRARPRDRRLSTTAEGQTRHESDACFLVALGRRLQASNAALEEAAGLLGIYQTTRLRLHALLSVEDEAAVVDHIRLLLEQLNSISARLAALFSAVSADMESELNECLRRLSLARLR